MRKLKLIAVLKSLNQIKIKNTIKNGKFIIEKLSHYIHIYAYLCFLIIPFNIYLYRIFLSNYYLKEFLYCN